MDYNWCFTLNEKITLKKQKNKKFLKWHIIITAIFFLSTFYVAFEIDYPNKDHDLLFYFYSGEEIIYGDPQNVIIFNAPVGWPIVLATVDSIINDPHTTSKILSTIFASGIVLTTYFIIKNIFDRKVALLGQTLIALSPMLHVEAILSHSEMVPTFLIFLALYFITKRELVQKDIALCSLFLGLSFMFRPQSLLVAIGILAYIITIIKNTKKQFLAIFILIFILSVSPLLIYNLTVSGNLIDTDPNFYLAEESLENKSHYENLLEEDKSFLSQIESNQSGLEIIFSEYWNNLFHNNPHFLFNLGLGHNNFSVFPLIPFIGILFTIGGILSIYQNIFKKKYLTFTLGLSGSLFLLLLITDNIEKYFLVPIVIPTIILGLISKNKINPNILALLIMSSIFMLLISIINIKTPHDILAVSIIPIAFSGYFIINIIPKIFVKIRNNKNTKITNYFLVVILILIIFMNIPLSIMIQKNQLYGENIDYKYLFENKKYTHIAVEYEEV